MSRFGSEPPRDAVVQTSDGLIGSVAGEPSLSGALQHATEIHLLPLNRILIAIVALSDLRKERASVLEFIWGGSGNTHMEHGEEVRHDQIFSFVSPTPISRVKRWDATLP